MTTIAGAWSAGRNARRAGTAARRKPLLLAFVAYLARALPAWKGVRTAVMQWSAGAAVCYGLFSTGHTLSGFIAVGVSLLVIEALGGDTRA